MATDQETAAAPGSTEGAGARRPFLRRVKLLNYKSIAYCDVELGPLTLLVGRNGAGKSNFLDALAFVVEALESGPDEALRRRLGFERVCHRGASDRRIGFELEFEPVEGEVTRYGFELEADAEHGFTVAEEWLSGWAFGTPMMVRREGRVPSPGPRAVVTWLPARNVHSSIPEPGPHRLFLTHYTHWNNSYQHNEPIQGIRTYNFHLPAMRQAQPADASAYLRHDGSNLAAVVSRLLTSATGAKERLLGYLSAIVPEIVGLEHDSAGPYSVLRFLLRGDAPDRPREFYAAEMSDGTLRAFGALVAVAQLANGAPPVKLVGIEEPEAALHPAASTALMDALREATTHTQVVVTTHSADLLDESDAETDRLLVVQSRGGTTEIGPIDQASRNVLRKHLYSPGELLRMDQLAADEVDLQRQRESIRAGASETAG